MPAPVAQPRGHAAVGQQQGTGTATASAEPSMVRVWWGQLGMVTHRFLKVLPLRLITLDRVNANPKSAAVWILVSLSPAKAPACGLEFCALRCFLLGPASIVVVKPERHGDVIGRGYYLDIRIAFGEAVSPTVAIDDVASLQCS